MTGENEPHESTTTGCFGEDQSGMRNLDALKVYDDDDDGDDADDDDDAELMATKKERCKRLKSPNDGLKIEFSF